MGVNRKPVQPKRAADARERPYALLAVVAIGAAASMLGVLTLPTVFCAGERGGDTPRDRAWCEAFAMFLWAPLTALVAGCLAGALGPTWRRFLGSLGGLVVGGIVANDTWGETFGGDLRENLLIVLVLVTPVFVIGYGIAGALRVLAARSRARPGSARHDPSIDWIG